ncbi:MAG: PilW family protein [Methylococcaceae bacterium]
MKNKSFQTGLSLIEIMIALLIGAFLIGGVLQIFISSKQTYRMQEGLSRLQENGRFALDFLARDVRMAGFLGCSSQVTLTNKLNTSVLGTENYFLYNSFDKAIEGFEASSTTAWTPAINAAITSPLGGSDIITIRRADDQGFTVTTHVFDTAANTSVLTLDATATTANLQSAKFLTSASPPANHCAIAVVSDCSAAATFQVSAVAVGTLSHNTGSSCSPDNSTNNLGKAYVGGQVYPINTVSFFIRNNPLTGSNQKPSLYRKVGSDDAEELVEGIENMQILYGVDTDTPFNGPNYYVTADNITSTNWPKVVSVRITLTVRTIDGNLTTTGDGRIRRTFTSTIALRNRLP